METRLQSTFERNVNKLWEAHKAINAFEQFNIEEHVELTSEQIVFITREYQSLINKLLVLKDITWK